MGLVWSAREGAAPGAPANARVSSGGERSEGSRRSETTQWAGARAGAGFRGGLAQMGRRRMKRRTRGAGSGPVAWMIWRRETGRVPDEEARMGARASVGKCCSPLVLGRGRDG